MAMAEEDAMAGEGDALLRSAYQVAREANVRRNLEELRALGLVPTEEEEGTAAQKAEEDKVEAKKAQKAAAERKRKASGQGVPQRKSRRLQRLEPDGKPIAEREPAAGDDEEEDGEPEDRVDVTMERKIARLRALHQSRGTVYKNKTVTYEHTWKRVRTMSDKALSRRVAVIERAVGQHCLAKMRMFAEVLILAGKTELAAEADAALQRLRRLVADPDPATAQAGVDSTAMAEAMAEDAAAEPEEDKPDEAESGKRGPEEVEPEAAKAAAGAAEGVAAAPAAPAPAAAAPA